MIKLIDLLYENKADDEGSLEISLDFNNKQNAAVKVDHSNEPERNLTKPQVCELQGKLYE
jgi:hypothetical protein